MNLLIIENVCDDIIAITPVTNGQKQQEFLVHGEEECNEFLVLYNINPLACRFAYMAGMYNSL